MDLSAFSGRHAGPSSHALDAVGSSRTDEGRGTDAAPMLNPKKAKLTREEIIRRIGKHYKLSPRQRTWSTSSLRVVLDTYEPVSNPLDEERLPTLNPQSGGLRCPHCGKSVSGKYNPGSYTCSSCKNPIEVRRNPKA